MYKLLIVIICCASINAAQANLIRNASFEDVPDNSQGQNQMPNDWLSINSTPDSYSNDGSYGIQPGDFGNFTGLTAHDGIRWMAGWSVANEQFGQLLTNTLSAGTSYNFSAYMLQAIRPDLDFPGGYEIYLSSDDSSVDGIAESVLLGSIGFTSDTHTWEQFTLNFVAPGNAANLPYLIFRPLAGLARGADGPYPGIDSLSLTAVPIPAAFYLLGSALLGLLSLRRKT